MSLSGPIDRTVIEPNLRREPTTEAVSPRSIDREKKATEEGDIEGRRDIHDESRESFREGETSESHNPKDGFSTKQG